MAFCKKINLSGVRNKERVIEQILKKEMGRSIQKVFVNEKSVTIAFSHNENYPIKNVVKQFSKKKHEKKIEDFISKFLDNNKASKGYSVSETYNTVYSVIDIIEMQDEYLIFFERNWP